MNLNQVTVPALNVAASVDFYCRLGLELMVSTTHYASVRAELPLTGPAQPR